MQVSRRECRLCACVLLLAVVLCVPQVALTAEQRPEEHYTLFVELRQPYESSRVALQRMLKAEGYDSQVEREQELSLVLTEAQIGKLFKARVRMRKVEASATAGTISQPDLEGARVPERFEKWIRRVYFDPQRG